MTLESRLRKIEGLTGQKNKSLAPLLLTLYQDDNKEEILKTLRAKYGENYEPRIIVICSSTREEARRKEAERIAEKPAINGLFYKEITDL